MTPPQNSPKKKRKKKSETSPSGKPKNLVCTVCKQRFVGVSVEGEVGRWVGWAELICLR